MGLFHDLGSEEGGGACDYRPPTTNFGTSHRTRCQAWERSVAELTPTYLIESPMLPIRRQETCGETRTKTLNRQAASDIAALVDRQ